MRDILKGYFQSFVEFLPASIKRWILLLISPVLFIISLIELYYHFTLGFVLTLLIAVLLWSISVFLAFHDERIRIKNAIATERSAKENIEAKLYDFYTLSNQLARLISEGNQFKHQLETKLPQDSVEKNIEIWYKTIHGLFDNSLPDRTPELERLWKYYLDAPDFIDSVKQIQEFLQSIRDTITP